jgi:hypothetical protein
MFCLALDPRRSQPCRQGRSVARSLCLLTSTLSEMRGLTTAHLTIVTYDTSEFRQPYLPVRLAEYFGLFSTTTTNARQLRRGAARQASKIRSENPE